MATQKNILVIGGGASGFFAAINCAIQHPNTKITIIEKSQKLLAKVRIIFNKFIIFKTMVCNVATATTTNPHFSQ